MKKQFHIDRDSDSKEVLTYLKCTLSLSTKLITKLKKYENGITVNGIHATVRQVLHEGDVLAIDLTDEVTDALPAATGFTPPDIIYEDQDIIVLNKPYGMPTHQSHGHYDDTLANSLAYYFASKNTPFVFRATNRLDKNTSGCVLVAKNKYSSCILNEQMKGSEIRKCYLAILEGELPNENGVIESYIRRKEKSVIFREAASDGIDSEYALTEYRKIDSNGSHSLVLAYPKTGRTHQLRVHFSHIGHPILADDMYGKASDLLSRHALHAISISFIHPTTKEAMILSAPLQDDMESFIKENFNRNNYEKHLKRLDKKE